MVIAVDALTTHDLQQRLPERSIEHDVYEERKSVRTQRKEVSYHPV